MWRWVISSCLLCGLLLVSQRSFGQISQHGLVAPSEAGRVGLKRAWYTHVEVDRAKGRLAYISQFISPTRSTTVYEIVHDRGRIEISEKHLNPFGIASDDNPLPSLAERFTVRLGLVGVPLGKDGAKSMAEEMVIELETRGLNPQMNERVAPEITLYVATDRGVVHALDGETGRTRWALPIGRTNHPTLEPAANDDFVAIVNGSILYVVSASDGKLVYQRQVKGAPGAGAAITGEHIHVPMINGMMESYSLTDSRKPVVFFKSHGRAMIQPTPTDRSICWTTDRGHLYVGHADRPGVRYRLEANDTIAARASYKAPNKLYVTSIDGYLYCIHEMNGNIEWRFSAGESLSQQPVVVDDAVFIVSETGNLFRVARDTGLEVWTTPRVKGFLAASKDRLYCTGEIGRVLVIDKKTGARLGSFDGVDLDLKFMNCQTDRIFVGTHKGLIQCLHEPALLYPVIHSIVGAEVEEKTPVIKGETTDPETMPAEPAVKPADSDVFGTGNAPPQGGKPPVDTPKSPFDVP